MPISVSKCRPIQNDYSVGEKTLSHESQKLYTPSFLSKEKTWIYTCHELHFAGCTYPFNHLHRILSSAFVYYPASDGGIMCVVCSSSVTSQQVQSLCLLCLCCARQRRLATDCCISPCFCLTGQWTLDVSQHKAAAVRRKNTRAHEMEEALHFNSISSRRLFVEKKKSD